MTGSDVFIVKTSEPAFIFSVSGYNSRAMEQIEITRRTSRLLVVNTSIRFTLSVLSALALFTYLRHESKRNSSLIDTSSSIVFTFSPLLTSAHTVDQSNLTIAGNNRSLFLKQLPIVAALIDARRLRAIATAQIGGLYGP